jgi:hypothetical protein
MPGETRGTTRAFTTEVLKPRQGFGLFEDPLNNGIQACIPLCHGKDRIASFRLLLESIRKEGVSPAQLISRDDGLFQRVGLCKRLDPGESLCDIL